MNKYLTTIIALVVIVVLLTGFFIAKKAGWLDPKAEPTADPDAGVVTGQIFAFFSEDENAFLKINGIESSNKGELLVLAKEGGEWRSTSHEALAVISKNVNSCLNSMRSLNGRLTYEGEMTESKRLEFGFEESTTFIRLSLSDGTEHKVIFGKDNQSGSSSYVWETGTEKVYLVDKYQLTSTLVDAVDLLDSKVFTFDDAGQISRVNITKDGSDYLKLQAIISTEVDVPRSWKVTYPLERAGDATTIESLVSSLTSMLVTGIEKMNCEDLSQYGLAPAKFKVSVTDPHKTVTLSVGEMNPDRTCYYVTIDNSTDVYLVKNTYITFTDTSLLSFMDEYIFMVTYTKLETVELDVLGRSYKLTYDARGERDDEIFTINGTNVYFDEERDYRGEFKRIGTAMYGIRLTGLEDEPAEKGELVCRIKYTEWDGTVNTVECYDRDGSSMYLYLNGSYQGGYGNRYLLTSNNENYGIIGTVDNLYAMMGIEDPQASQAG
ncbi:MAG: DUF4340 domain-containing protein [Clostridia bacterium]|nr:DUF4340 domain-containing protein [Clostridia bacterium]